MRSIDQPMLRNNISLAVLTFFLTGCSSLRQMSVPSVPGLGAHKIDIQQGNVVTKDMIDKLQPGMTRSQVRFVLGTPLLVDPFRSDRWDYFYSLNKAGERIEQRQLKVYFKDDKMLRYEGDVVADAKPAAKPVTKPADKAVATPAEKPAVTPAQKPAAAPVAKPDSVEPSPAPPVAAKPDPQPPTAQPAAPERETPTAADVKPPLRLAPDEGKAALPEQRVAPPAATETAPAGAKPAEPETLESPPLPRLVLPPEPTEPGAGAAMPGTAAKP